MRLVGMTGVIGETFDEKIWNMLLMLGEEN